MSEDTSIVLIIGAGASAEFGLPVGSELQKQIAHETKFSENGAHYSHNEVFYEAMERIAFTHIGNTINDINQAKKRCKKISDGVLYAQSIDNFLHQHKSDKVMAEIGKLAICSAILKAENSSNLQPKRYEIPGVSTRLHKNLSHPSDSWLGQFVKILTSGATFEGFCERLSKIQFISFNYDRCIEQYFSVNIPKVYPDEDFKIERLRTSLRIIHPYGHLGDIFSNSGQVEFGNCRHELQLLAAQREIKTFTEGLADKVVWDIVDDALRSTKILFFLGYGFIGINDELISRGSPYNISNIYGTVYGQKDEQVQSISHELVNSFACRWVNEARLTRDNAVILKPEKCGESVFRFSRQLSAAVANF